METRVNFMEKGTGAIRAMYGLGGYLAASPLDESLLNLVYFRVSQINGLRTFPSEASRIPCARRTESGENILYDDQDATLWDRELIRQGRVFLDRSATGEQLSAYHLEAGIAYGHCQKEDTSRKWESILHYYDLLTQVNAAPAVTLNRLYALYRARGREEALREAAAPPYAGNTFYHLLMGELCSHVENRQALDHFAAALGLVKTDADKAAIRKKIGAIQSWN